MQRFWSKVDIRGEDECWEWQAERNPKGYGRFKINGRKDYAHRVAYKLRVGDIPAGEIVMHDCDNPPCCNPAHLFTGTHADNVKDMIQKGRYSPHGGNHRDQDRKLSWDQAESIRYIASQGVPQRKIADMFGVSRSTVANVINRRAYRSP